MVIQSLKYKVQCANANLVAFVVLLDQKHKKRFQQTDVVALQTTTSKRP